jgi:ATP-dependent DNA helicase RecG
VSLKKIRLPLISCLARFHNRAKQEINGNRIFFNDTHTSTEEVRLEPVYRLKEGIKLKKIRLPLISCLARFHLPFIVTI